MWGEKKSKHSRNVVSLPLVSNYTEATVFLLQQMATLYKTGSLNNSK